MASKRETSCISFHHPTPVKSPRSKVKLTNRKLKNRRKKWNTRKGERQFQPSWKLLFPWVEYSHGCDSMYCSMKYPEKANISSIYINGFLSGQGNIEHCLPTWQVKCGWGQVKIEIYWSTRQQDYKNVSLPCAVVSVAELTILGVTDKLNLSCVPSFTGGMMMLSLRTVQKEMKKR